MKEKTQIPNEENRIGGGVHGTVHRISSDKVAKFEWARGLSMYLWKLSPFGKTIKREYEICQALYEKGVSVPKPHGIEDFPYPYKNDQPLFPRKFPAFVREYIDGIVPYPVYLKPCIQQKIDELVEIERSKVWDLGFIPHDGEGGENTLWVPETERIVLIDFALWEMPPEKGVKNGN